MERNLTYVLSTRKSTNDIKPHTPPKRFERATLENSFLIYDLLYNHIFICYMCMKYIYI